MERIPGIFHRNIYSVTPSDSVPLSGKISWLHVDIGGDLVVKGADNDTTVTLTVTDDSWIPFGSGNYVYNTNTTATGITAWGS